MKNLLGLREVVAVLVNKLTLTKQGVGFTVAGGTTTKTLTVNTDFTTDNYYTKAEIDTIVGDIDAALIAIIG